MIIPKQNFKRSTWKNGLGFTDEIAIHPSGASLAKGDFLWRISSARIENASSFSVFPHHERSLVVLKGRGIRLFHRYEEGEPEDQVELPVLEPYEFPGDIPSRCELIDGPIVDFSVFTRSGEVNARVEIRELSPDEEWVWEAQGRWNFVFALENEFESGEGTVQEGDAFQAGPGEHMIRARGPGARILLVAIEG
jgi:environmental stress-induced protein Ves